MKSAPTQPELTTYNDVETQSALGERILHDLVWTVEKQIPLTNAEQALQAAARRLSRAKSISEQLVANWLEINSERSYAQNKFEHRKLMADLYIGSDIALQVSDKTGEMLAEGTLEYVDYQNATMALQTPDGESTLLDFAEAKAIPEDVQQSYYGHAAIVELRVTSAPAQDYWKLRD